MSKFRPFVPKGEKQNISDKGDNIVVDSDGVVRQDVIGLVLNPKKYDKRTFCKIYREGLFEMMNLGIPEIKVLLYFIDSMWYRPTIVFDMGRCMTFTGYRNKTYIYKAISVLKDKQIILKIKNCEYQLNPMMFYKGNVIKLKTNKNDSK